MATLKISDLSVGDWIHHDFYEQDMRVVTIYGDNERIIAESSSGHGVTCHLDHFTPIPITAEILEKNGFVEKNYDNGKMWDWWCDNVLVRKYADEDIYRFIVALNSMHYTTTMVVGKHTHQLQHALRLAGVDKEINL